ncbi:hypothetical protein MMC31_007681 [Peltigera leucophlebia]|nr:hypothetical protein [Peltigera leucophlebia]
MDFGLSWQDCGSRKSGDGRVHWDDVEVVGEHTDKKSTTGKSVQLAEYARHALLHQPDRHFIFGLLVHHSNLRVFLFTSLGVISGESFDVLADPVMLRILIRGLICLSPEKRGRDINFTRVNNLSQPDRYQRMLNLQIKMKQAEQVEDSGMERLVETAAGEVGGVGYAVLKEKHSPCWVGSNFNNAANCGFSDAKATLLGPLHRSLSLFGRRTQVSLAELTVCNRLGVSDNQSSPIQVVIKIIARDIKATLNEAEILHKAPDSGCAVPRLVLHMEFTIQGHPDTTQDMILQNWQTVMETLIIRRKREITISQSIGVPLGILWPPPFLLLKIARDTIECLQSFHKVGILHRDVSINNIMCTLKKGDNIVLESGACVSANAPTLLADGQDKGLAAFLNDYDLAVYASEASGLKTLTGTWAFIAPSRLRGWGVYHAHQDVVSVVLFVLWMACLEPVERSLLENKPERLNTTPTSFPNPSTQHNHDLRTRPTPMSKSKGQTNSGSAQPGASASSRTVPSLDPKHPHIRWTSNDALEFKETALSNPWDIFKFFTPLFQNAVFRRAIVDMTEAISITPQTTYVPDRAMREKMGEGMGKGDEEAQKDYVRSMDSRFPVLVGKLIEIIDLALKSENWTK